eukprot:831097_1
MAESFRLALPELSSKNRYPSRWSYPSEISYIWFADHRKSHKNYNSAGNPKYMMNLQLVCSALQGVLPYASGCLAYIPILLKLSPHLCLRFQKSAIQFHLA